MSVDTSVQPPLGLLAQSLEKQADAQGLGIAGFDGEVTPYEVGPLQPLDAKLAWDDALAALAFLARDRSAGGRPRRTGPSLSAGMNRSWRCRSASAISRSSCATFTRS